MSLLEDIFLRDEADEARELERIIEGDEYDEKPQQRSDSDDNSEKEDEAEEEKKRVDPLSTKTKRAVRNPRFILNPARLTGPRGIQVIPDHFKDFKFKGKGHEKEDLNLALKKLEHWAYRLYPKFQFEDCLKKIETLGKKRPVMVHLQKIRSDQYVSEETIVQKDSSDDESAPVEREEDEFDKLLQQQIDLARSTPGPGSVKKSAIDTTIVDSISISAPKATSSPSISEEQKERMIRNRKLANERRLARLKNNSNVTNSAEDKKVFDINTVEVTDNPNHDIRDPDGILINKKQRRSGEIDTSDDEAEITMVHESITVDIHADVSIGERHQKNHTEDNKRQSLNEEDDNEIENEVLKENQITNINDQTDQRQNDTCEAPMESIAIGGKMGDLDKKLTDNIESKFEQNSKLSDNASIVNKNQCTEKIKDVAQDTVSQVKPNVTEESGENLTYNEDNNIQADRTINTNDESMDVDLSEDF